MEIKEVNIEILKPFEGNPRKHGKEQLRRLMKSLKEFGFVNPILATKDNMVVAGHARIEAAKEIGLKKVPVIYLPFGGKRALAYNLADNKIALLAEWYNSRLADLLQELDTGEFEDIEITGFSEEEIEEIMAAFPEGSDGRWGDDPEVDFAKELEEKHDYIVLYFDNREDWEQAKREFKLKRVKDLDSLCESHKPAHFGLGRVIPGKEILERLLDG